MGNTEDSDFYIHLVDRVHFVAALKSFTVHIEHGEQITRSRLKTLRSPLRLRRKR